MQQISLLPQGGVRIHLLGAGLPLPETGEILAVEGAAGRLAAALPQGAVLAVACDSARDLLAAGPPDPEAVLAGWRRGIEPVLRLAARDARVIPIARKAWLREPAGMAAALRARLAGSEVTPVLASPPLADHLAELLLHAFPAAREAEARLARLALGVPDLRGGAALMVAGQGILAADRDLRQQLLERQVELGEQQMATAELLALAQDQLIATRAAADAAYADLRARLGEGPVPPLDARRGDALAQELEAVLASTSWRLTAPLRRVADRLRRYRMKSEASM